MISPIVSRSIVQAGIKTGIVTAGAALGTGLASGFAAGVWNDKFGTGFVSGASMGAKTALGVSALKYVRPAWKAGGQAMRFMHKNHQSIWATHGGMITTMAVGGLANTFMSPTDSGLLNFTMGAIGAGVGRKTLSGQYRKMIVKKTARRRVNLLSKQQQRGGYSTMIAWAAGGTGTGLAAATGVGASAAHSLLGSSNQSKKMNRINR